MGRDRRLGVSYLRKRPAQPSDPTIVALTDLRKDSIPSATELKHKVWTRCGTKFGSSKINCNSSDYNNGAKNRSTATPWPG